MEDKEEIELAVSDVEGALRMVRTLFDAEHPAEFKKLAQDQIDFGLRRLHIIDRAIKAPA